MILVTQMRNHLIFYMLLIEIELYHLFPHPSSPSQLPSLEPLPCLFSFKLVASYYCCYTYICMYVYKCLHMGAHICVSMCTYVCTCI